jgi:hypothetical protein
MYSYFGIGDEIQFVLMQLRRQYLSPFPLIAFSLIINRSTNKKKRVTESRKRNNRNEKLINNYY